MQTENTANIRNAIQHAGGAHLGAVRTWIQWNCHNGSDVIWDSDDILEFRRRLTVKELEELAVRVAVGALSERFNYEESRALWSATKSLKEIKAKTTDDTHNKALDGIITFIEQLQKGYAEVTKEQVSAVVQNQWSIEIKSKEEND
jgi:hypothetical protein